MLEYCSTHSGAYCAKLMADLGAEVIHVEPPGTGDDARRCAPFPGDVPDPEKSGLFLFLNTNKLGITLDPETPRGREIFERLASNVDVLVEDQAPGRMEAMGLGFEDSRKRNPGLIWASLTPFGRSGPRKDDKAYPLNVAHACGQGYVLPLPAPSLDRAPTMIGGKCTEYDPGQTASLAVLSALFARARTGRGQLVEISLQEAALAMLRVEVVTFPNHGNLSSRSGPWTERLITMMFSCKDGHIIMVTPLEHQWESLMKLIGNHEWFENKRFSDGRMVRAEDPQAMLDRIGRWMEQYDKKEICRRGQELSIPITPINTSEDVVHSEQMKEREIFVEMEHPALGRLRIPSAPYKFSKTPWALERPAPLLGEHNEAIYCDRLGFSAEELEALQKSGVI